MLFGSPPPAGKMQVGYRLLDTPENVSGRISFCEIADLTGFHFPVPILMTPALRRMLPKPTRLYGEKICITSFMKTATADKKQFYIWLEKNKDRLKSVLLRANNNYKKQKFLELDEVFIDFTWRG